MSKERPPQGWREIAGYITAPLKYTAAAVRAGIKPNSQKKDLAVLFSEIPAQTAALFTLNRVVAAPVLVSQKHLRSSHGQAQAIIVNSGNANACTGKSGLQDARKIVQLAASALGIESHSVLVASTGVIGQRLPIDKMTLALPRALEKLSERGGAEFSEGILTTDTCTKNCVVESVEAGRTIRIAGTAKGSGMIHPNLATMLAFITTDANLTLPLLNKALRDAGEVSFNRVSVDGDTSTNDSVFLLANGANGVPKITKRGKSFDHFRAGLTYVCSSLSRQIAQDGEGARKLVTIIVQGGKSVQEAERVGRAIATSPLVKTAMAGADANWGRILCAVGYSGAAIDPSRVEIAVNNLQVCQRGQGIRFDESRAKKLLSQSEIQIEVQLRRGRHSATFWTCDFTEDYIRINASYRT